MYVVCIYWESLTKPVSMCGHWRHSGPHFGDGIVAFHHVGRLESISPSDYIQFVVYHCHAKLQPPPVHGSNLDPGVCPQVILLYGGGPWNQQQEKTFSVTLMKKLKW